MKMLTTSVMHCKVYDLRVKTEDTKIRTCKSERCVLSMYFESKKFAVEIRIAEKLIRYLLRAVIFSKGIVWYPMQYSMAIQ